MQTNVVRLAAVCLLSLAGTGSVSALDYPTRPVRFIVGYPAGGSTDILARIIGQHLSERLGHPFVVETGQAPPTISARSRGAGAGGRLHLATGQSCECHQCRASTTSSISISSRTSRRSLG